MGDPYQTEREQMVETQLKRRGIDDSRVLEAFRNVPRHRFVPDSLKDSAYTDGPLLLMEGQAISQPYMVAVMTQRAGVTSGDRVLEIGTGSGYQSAILAEMGAKVYTVERIAALSEQAAGTLRRLGYLEVHTKVGDGTWGWEQEAPFDVILVTAAAPDLPEPLLGQLVLGGRLLIPLQEGGPQILNIVERHPEGFRKRRGECCTFVPLIGEHGWEKGPHS